MSDKRVTRSVIPEGVGIIRNSVTGKILIADKAVAAEYIQSLQSEIEALRQSNEWTSCNESLPEYGDPVQIKANNVIQNITYVFKGGDYAYWFEPYNFEHDHDMKIPINKVESWRAIQPPIGSKT